METIQQGEIKENALPMDMREMHGKLIDIGHVLHLSHTSLSKATLVANDCVADLSSVDIKTVDATVYEAKIERAATVRAKLGTTLEAIENRRKPFTVFFDSIRTLFTTDEGKIKLLIDQIKVKQNAWEKEKFDRNKKVKDDQAKKIQETQAAIERKAQIERDFSKNVLNHTATALKKLIQSFNAKTNAELEAHGKVLAGWKPSLESVWALFPPMVLGSEEFAAANKSRFFEVYAHTMTKAKQELIDSIPGRLKLAADDKKKLDEQKVKQVDEQITNAVTVITDEIAAKTEGEKVDAVMDISMTATELTAPAKGAGSRNVYKPTTAAHLLPLIKSYLENDLKNLTVEQMLKKFDFVITAANKRLNDGESGIISGVPTEKEFTTRTA